MRWCVVLLLGDALIFIPCFGVASCFQHHQDSFCGVFRGEGKNSVATVVVFARAVVCWCL